LPDPKMLIRFGAKSATGWANWQISLRCLGMLRRNIGRAQTLFSGA
jgi:hypothetical protein